MLRTTLVLIIIIVSHIFSQNINKFSKESDEDRIIRLTYSLQFDEAIKLVENKKLDNPSSLQYKYFHAMILFRKSNYLSFQKSIGYSKDQNQIFSLNKSAFDEFTEITQIGDKVIEKNPRDTVALFYSGAAYGYLGLFYAGMGENMKAASVGKKGLEHHEKLIELCPNWGDVYLSKGIFNYYASDVPWYIKPLLWILGKSGTESSAHKYLKLAIENGRFAKYEALEMIAQLYIRQKKVEYAFAIIDKLIQELPESKYYYYFRFGVLLANKEMLEESDKLIMKGINLSKRETLSNFENLEIGYMYVYLAYFYNNIKNYNKVILLWKELINRRIVPGFDSWGYIMLGNSYMELGNKTEARECYNWVLMNSNIENHKNIAKEKLSKL